MIAAENFLAAARGGERAPFSYGMLKDKTFFSFDAQAGRPAAVILAGTLPQEALAPLVAAFEARMHDFVRAGADVLLFVNGHTPHALDYDGTGKGLRIVYCLPRLFQEWGFRSLEPAVVVIDRNARVIAPVNPGAPAEMAKAALACLPRFASQVVEDVAAPAPILIIPNVFSAGFCRELIAHFEANPHMRGGMASVDASGAAYHKIDESKKMREDFLLAPGDPRHQRVMEALSRCCLAEIKKAFQFDAVYTDRILLARYDENGGCFLRHRDNAAPAVAFRQFALSANLNTEEYDGGHLLFPEYNSHRYKPPRGAVTVFSTSLLHEATPVLKGKRYVLLTFLHNAEAEMRRLAAKRATESFAECGT
jgi:predicted 2-oxoglutarate/Fe(II)-dependent dioxygenase YbiX